ALTYAAAVQQAPPLPLVGDGRGWGSIKGARPCPISRPPTPTVPHKGEGERTYPASAVDVPHERIQCGPPVRTGPIGKLMAKPCELALGIAAGVLFRLCGGGGKGYVACNVANQPGHPVGLHGGQERIETPRRQRPNLIERSSGQHGIETCVDPSVQLL